MIKGIIISAAISVTCFLIFFATEALYSVVRSSGYDRNANSVYIVENAEETRAVFDTVVQGTDSKTDYMWTVNNDFPNIHLNTSGARVFVKQYDGDRINIYARVPSGKKIHAAARYTPDDSDLTIIAAEPNVSFDDQSDTFNTVNWREDVFGGDDGIELVISFPRTIYDTLEIKHGSGEMYISDLYSENTNIAVGSGTLAFERSREYLSYALSTQINSGKASLKNVYARSSTVAVNSGTLLAEYGENGFAPAYMSLDMKSGKAYVNGGTFKEFTAKLDSGKLMGNFSSEKLNADVGTGRADLAAKVLSEAELDVSGGKLCLYPAEGGSLDAVFVTSGSIELEYDGLSRMLTADTDDNAEFGSGDSFISASVETGSIFIGEYEKAPSIEFTYPLDPIPEAPTISAATDNGTGVTVIEPDTASAYIGSISSGYISSNQEPQDSGVQQDIPEQSDSVESSTFIGNEEKQT